jgi:hypothetical protein
MEKPYATFSDLHSQSLSRPASTYAQSDASFYSLGTDVLLPQVQRAPILPPLPAVFTPVVKGRGERGSLGSMASFGPGLPYDERQREETLSPFHDRYMTTSRGVGDSEKGSVYGGIDGRR